MRVFFPIVFYDILRRSFITEDRNLFLKKIKVYFSQILLIIESFLSIKMLRKLSIKESNRKSVGIQRRNDDGLPKLYSGQSRRSEVLLELRVCDAAANAGGSDLLRSLLLLARWLGLSCRVQAERGGILEMV
jgi:hypothetical protein